MKSAWTAPRTLCERCRRPPSVCVCAHLPDLAPTTRVLILQHPRERRVAIGTARMAARCLRGCSVAVGTRFDDHPDVVRALADTSRRAVLLWPGPDSTNLATDLATLSASAASPAPITLLVVDGTWTTAKSLIRDNPRVSSLPRVSIAPDSPSEYRIRREPRAECLSTIEAIAAALGVLEGDRDAYRAMLRPFRSMVDAQIAHEERGGEPRDRSRLLARARRVWAPPPPLRDPSRVVLVAAEANAWPYHVEPRRSDELVHWLAVRGDGSERFERIVRPRSDLAPAVTSQTELSAERLRSAGPRESLAPDFAAFLREGDALVSWSHYAQRLRVAEHMAPSIPPLYLRRVVADWQRRSPSSLEGCAERLGLSPEPLGAGRGGRRLGLLLAVYRTMLSSPRP